MECRMSECQSLNCPFQMRTCVISGGFLKCCKGFQSYKVRPQKKKNVKLILENAGQLIRWKSGHSEFGTI